MARSASHWPLSTQLRTLVNQQVDGTRSTNRPSPKLRSSPGKSSGIRNSQRASFGSSAAWGAYQRRWSGSQRAPADLAASFSAYGTSSHKRPGIGTPYLLGCADYAVGYRHDLSRMLPVASRWVRMNSRQRL